MTAKPMQSIIIPTRIIVLLLVVISTYGCTENKTERTSQMEAGRNIDFTGEVTFFDTEGDSLTAIQVAVADEPEERNQGLMDVNSLPESKGMLFIFEEEQELSFWMANTPLSLDIIFINAGLEIVRIHHSTQPFAEKNFTSEQPALYVVETNGGFCISHDIREGMKIETQI